MSLTSVLALLVFSFLIGIAIGASLAKKHYVKKHRRELEQLQEYCGDLMRESLGFWAIDGGVSIRDRHKKPPHCV